MVPANLRADRPTAAAGLRTTRWSGFPLLGVCLLLLVPYAHAQTSRQVRRELERLQAEGRPVHPEDFQRPAVPPDDNGAALLLDAAERLPELDEGEEWALWTFDDPQDEEERRAQLPLLEKLIAARAAPLAQACEAAFRPNLQFSLDFSQGMRIDLPQVAACNELAKLLWLQASLRAQAGDSSQALHGLEATLRMARGLLEEPVLISHLVGIAVLGGSLETLREVVAMQPPGPSEAERLCALLATLDLPGSFERSLDGERCLGLRSFVEIVDEEIAKVERKGDVELAALRAHFDRDRLHYLDFLRDATALLQTPIAGRVARLVALQNETAERCKQQLLPVSGLMMPFLSGAAQSNINAQTELAMARAALGVLARAAETGTPPMQLEAHDIDVRNGQPFGIKLKGRGIVVHAQLVDGDDWAPSDWVLPLH